MVLGVIRYISEYRGVTGTLPGLLGLMGLVVEERRHAKVWRAPP